MIQYFENLKNFDISDTELKHVWINFHLTANLQHKKVFLRELSPYTGKT